MPARPPLRINRSSRTLSRPPNQYDSGATFLGQQGQPKANMPGQRERTVATPGSPDSTIGRQPGPQTSTAPVGQQGRFRQPSLVTPQDPGGAVPGGRRGTMPAPGTPIMSTSTPDDRFQRSMGNEVRSSYDAPRSYSRVSPFGNAGGMISAPGFTQGGPMLGAGEQGGFQGSQRETYDAGRDNTMGTYNPSDVAAQFAAMYRSTQGAPPAPAPLPETEPDPQDPNEGAETEEAGSPWDRTEEEDEYGTSAGGLSQDQNDRYGSINDPGTGGTGGGGGGQSTGGSPWDRTGAEDAQSTGAESGGAGGGGGQGGTPENTSGYSEKDAAWVRFLEENGYSVETASGGDTQIQGQGGRGDSGLNHGRFGDPYDYSERVGALWRGFEEQWNKDHEAENNAKRRDEMAELLGMLPEIPEFDEASTNEVIDAARQERALESGAALDAMMAGAARARLGAGAQAGLQGQLASRQASEMATQAADIRLQAQMQNYQAQLAEYANRVKFIDGLISDERNIDSLKLLNAQRNELLTRESMIQRAMQDIQLRSQERQAAMGMVGAGVGGILGGFGTGLGSV